MSRRQTLAERRAMLVLECALQRNLLRAQTRQIGWPTGKDWIVSGQNMMSRLRQIPYLPALAGIVVAAVVVLTPGKLAGLVRNGLTMWQLWRTIRFDGKPAEPDND